LLILFDSRDQAHCCLCPSLAQFFRQKIRPHPLSYKGSPPSKIKVSVCPLVLTIHVHEGKQSNDLVLHRKRGGVWHIKKAS
jgi:hypothetical protein